MNFAQMLAARNAKRAEIVARMDALETEARGLVSSAEDGGLTAEQDARALEIVRERATERGNLATIDSEIEDIKREQAADEQAQRDAERANPTGAVAPAGVITQEARTYEKTNDPKGLQFARDVALAFMGNSGASMRLERHMTEEKVERAAAGTPLVERAVGTSAFSGLVIPQYLVDQYAPIAREGRHFADACTHHDLPAQGMSISIGAVTTGTSVDDQASEGAAVDETDIDDTLQTIAVRTSGGSQTVSRQGVERGVGIEDTIVSDLLRAHDVNRDSKLINLATYGLDAVAADVTYTDASPTGAELYPKLLQAASAVEAALLDQGAGDVFLVMHSRRWYWLLAQMTSTWPLIGTAGVATQAAGIDYQAKYGPGFRGVLPSGIPVVVDNNIGTTLGAGTEDAIYAVSKSEAHLWEDPSQPFLIRAEQTKAKNLQIDLVAYSYYAFTFTRRAHVQSVNGTGLIAPTF